MGPRLFDDEPGQGRGDAGRGTGGFRIDPADRPFASSEPERPPEPWIQGDSGGFRIGITRVAIALLFMAVAAGGLWFAYSKGRSATANGEVPLIKADQTAMKVKPDNPGGVDEDGDTPIYNVGAGNGATVEQLLPPPEQPMPKPQPDVTPPPLAAAAPTPAPTTPVVSAPIAPAPVAQVPATPPAASDQAPVTVATPAAPSQTPPAPVAVAAAAPPPPASIPAPAPIKQVAMVGGPLRIQIAATRDIASAHKEWARLKAAHMAVLGDLKAFGVRVDLGSRGIFYRIQAGPIATRADAVRRCAQLKQSGIGCIIVRQP